MHLSVPDPEQPLKESGHIDMRKEKVMEGGVRHAKAMFNTLDQAVPLLTVFCFGAVSAMGFFLPELFSSRISTSGLSEAFVCLAFLCYGGVVVFLGFSYGLFPPPEEDSFPARSKTFFKSSHRMHLAVSTTCPESRGSSSETRESSCQQPVDADCCPWSQSVVPHT